MSRERNRVEDMITPYNVMDTYTEGKYVCFILKNGIKVKLDPNKSTMPVDNRS